MASIAIQLTTYLFNLQGISGRGRDETGAHSLGPFPHGPAPSRGRVRSHALKEVPWP